MKYLKHPSLRKTRMRVHENKNGKRYSRPARYHEELTIKYGPIAGNVMFLAHLTLVAGLSAFIAITVFGPVWGTVVTILSILYFISN